MTENGSNHSNNLLAFDTPEKIHAVRILTLRKALQLEIRTGMRVSSRAHTIASVKQLGFTGRTRKAALVWLNKYIEDNKILPDKPSKAEMIADWMRQKKLRERKERQDEAKLSALGYGPPEDYEDEHIDEMEGQE